MSSGVIQFSVSFFLLGPSGIAFPSGLQYQHLRQKIRNLTYLCNTQVPIRRLLGKI